MMGKPIPNPNAREGGKPASTFPPITARTLSRLSAIGASSAAGAQRRQVPLAVGWTLVHEMYFYVAFATFLALRIPIFADLITWGLVLL
jgi:hypothetical protein